MNGREVDEFLVSAAAHWYAHHGDGGFIEAATAAWVEVEHRVGVR